MRELENEAVCVGMVRLTQPVSKMKHRCSLEPSAVPLEDHSDDSSSCLRACLLFRT